ncbi:isochorismatase family protein [Alteromonas sediminis]|uniref:Isochorismatase family protein n=1 Tax=Alteromonas sediminis TaxID=2259342 RepID=A0A3N5Y3N8_9ALTE|nr:isochorismatase family protein [Alteromonas sediminis]RPJ68572.1 isochorismatase family protein [Alteromonas sediminis]
MQTTENTALLVVDIQGKLARLVNKSEQCIANTIKLIECCQILSIPVVVLEQNPKGLGATVPEITASLQNARYFEKFAFSGLGEPAIRDYITSLNRQHWLVAGIEAHICVYQTARDLLKEQLDVALVSDCVASRLQANVDLAVQNLREQGALITSVEMCVYELLTTSQSPYFKAVLEKIK